MSGPFAHASPAWPGATCESAFLGLGDEGDTLPPDPHSIAGREPELLRVLREDSELFREVDLERYFLESPQTTVKQITRELISKRARFQRQIHAYDIASRKWSESERKLLDRIETRVFAKADERFLLELQQEYGSFTLRDMTNRRYPDRQAALQLLHEHLKHYHSWIHEALVALSVRGFKAWGQKASAFISDEQWLHPPAEYARILRLFFHDDESLMGREIDVVFKNGRAWGEVKNYRLPLQTTHIYWRKIIRQAQALAELRTLYNRGFDAGSEWLNLPTVQELHYFVENGIGESAAAELEALGFIVHGPRVPDEFPGEVAPAAGSVRRAG